MISSAGMLVLSRPAWWPSTAIALSALGDHARDLEVRQHVEREAVLLRAREQRVEHRDLGAERAADVAVAAAAAGAEDVRVHQLGAAGQPRGGGGEAARRLADRAQRQLANVHQRAHLRDRVAKPGGVDPALRPLLQHRVRRVEAERVVDGRPAADAHALQQAEAEVGGELERALVVELEVLLDLVLAEVARVDVRAALEHEHLLAGLGPAVGEQAAGGAGADDHRVVVGPPRRRGERAQLRPDVDRRGLRAMAALGVGLELDRVPAALVAVVAEIGHLRGDADRRLHDPAHEARQAAAPGGDDEDRLERALARRGLQRAEREQRGERQLDPPLRARLEPGQVAVDVVGDLQR